MPATGDVAFNKSRLVLDFSRTVQCHPNLVFINKDVKNCLELRFYPTSKLTHFMDTGRDTRHQGVKDSLLLTAVAVARVLAVLH